MPRSNIAIFSGAVTAVMMTLAIVVGGITAGSIGNVADDTGTTVVVPPTTTDVPTSPGVQPDSNGHGWID
jgi:hypothetical protein